MGTQKKTAKGRLDKFYKLAKEQGYRARSAFKLVHLNRKYDLLSKSKCCIDLCAAPGGWLQVAEKYMPKGSLILGVDLNAIKPIPHVTTFVSDITTPQCRQIIRSHLHDWKADLVLHDGAPNVGSAWVQDAFTQNELVLQSLKLATEFLVKGGNFVTKVFRSQDYNALMWVFGQLFKSVEATKPPSSRNVSAEIFVVCQDFLAPKHIDPKFLDPKHVFKDVAPLPTSITTPAVDATNPDAGPSTSNGISQSANAIAKSQSGTNAYANVFMPEKKRRHREGYADGELTNFHAGTAMEYIRGGDPVGILGTWNTIEFKTEEEKAWLKSRHTTADIVANCQDLKVLGKGDFKALIKWRLAIRLEMGLDVKADPTQDATEEVVVEPIDEEQEISDELKRLQDAKTSRQKRERKRHNEKKARDLLKLQLNMTAPEDLDNEDRDLAGEEMFDLGEGEREAVRRGRKGGMEAHLAEQDGMSGSESSDESSEGEDEDDEVFDSDEERELRLGALEGQIDGMYDDYQSRMAERDAKFRVKQARLKDRNYDAWHGVGKGANGDGNASDSDAEGDDGVDKGYRNQMIRQPRRGDPDPEEEEEEEEEGGWNVKMAAKARVGESDSDSSDDEGDRPAKKARKGKSTHFASDDEAPVANGSAVNGKGKAKANGLVTSLTEQADRAQMSRQAQLWFDQGVFKGMGDLAALDGADEEDEEEEEEEEEEESGEEDDEMNVDSDDSDAVYAKGRQGVNGVASDDDMDVDGDGFEIVPAAASDSEAEWDVDDEDQDEVKRKRIADKGLLTAEAVTMATRLVNRETTLSQMMDDGFNRQSGYHKDGLPTWFLDDENKHYKANIPVTKEAMAALKERQRALDARPIKKVAEAKARKKMKAHARLEKAKKKADGVMDSEDLSMKEKARAVAKAMGRGKAGVKTQEKKVVVARGVNRGVKGRPKGVKGRYKIVDPRMRKETRALKRIKKASAKKRG